MIHRVRISLAFAALALGLAPTVFAQRPVIVFGGGFARDCYEAVKKDSLVAIRALDICTVALDQEELSPSNRAATHINRGILHMRQQSHGRAAQDFDAALKLSPDMPEAKINLGAMHYYLGDYPAAVVALNEGVKVEDTESRAAAYYNRALAYERMNNLEAAYADYGQALAVDPQFELAAKQLKRFTRVSAAAP
jgi:tetratricopeptide (TPR) repeat protein